MFAKRLPRRNRNHTMQIGEAVKVTVAALAREDDQCPNNVELEIGEAYLPAGVGPIRIRFERLGGLNPTISIDAPRQVPITHESCGVLPNDD